MLTNWFFLLVQQLKIEKDLNFVVFGDLPFCISHPVLIYSRVTIFKLAQAGGELGMFWVFHLFSLAKAAF